MTYERRLRATHLNDVIRNQGRTKRWLAGRVGLSESYLGRIISGTFPVREDKAQEIADILGEPLFLLFDSTDVAVNATQLEEAA